MKISRFFRERDPTQGSIVKTSLIWTSCLWPNTIFWILVHGLNLFWLSRIGVEAIAAVAIGSAAFMCLMVPIQGIVISIHSLVGGFDRKDHLGLEKRVKQILSTTWLASIFLAAVGCLLAPLLLRLLGAEPEVIDSAIIYLRIQAIAGIISFSFWPTIEMIRSTRSMVPGMIFMAIVLALQGLFDYLFILGKLGLPQMGVAGASLSRAISAAIGAGIGFWWLGSGKWLIKLNFRNWQDFKIRARALKEIFRIAGFNILQNSGRQAVQMFILTIIAPFGTLALGAYEIGQRFFRYCQMFGMDLGKTTAIGVSNNLVEHKIKRAEQWGQINAGISTALMVLLSTPLIIFANQVVGIFSQDPEVISIGVNYFRITVLGYIFLMGGTVLERVFTGVKDTFTPMWVSLLTAGIQVSLALLFSKVMGLGVTGIWWAILAGMIVHGTAMLILFKRGCWKPKKII